MTCCDILVFSGVYDSSSLSSGTSTTSSSSSTGTTGVGGCASARFLLNLADVLILLLVDARLSPSSASVSSAFLFGDVVRVLCGFLAAASTSGLAFTKASTVSSIDQLLRNLSSCSPARHRGHFPSFESALRMHKEQKVWQQDVSIGVR